MYRATKDVMLPTTIIGSLPRPTWYTENLGTRMFLDAMVSSRYREQYVDTLPSISANRRSPGSTSAPTAIAASIRSRRTKLDQLSSAPHAGLRARRSELARAGARRIVVSARPHPARYLERASCRNRRSRRPRRNAIHRALESRAAADHAAREVRRRLGRDGRLRLQDDTTRATRPDAGDRRRLQRRATRTADAGCPVIQMEEPQIHLLAARGIRKASSTPNSCWRCSTAR